MSPTAMPTDIDLAGARADLVEWCANTKVLSGYTAAQIERLAVFLAYDRAARKVRGDVQRTADKQLEIFRPPKHLPRKRTQAGKVTG